MISKNFNKFREEGKRDFIISMKIESPSLSKIIQNIAFNYKYKWADGLYYSTTVCFESAPTLIFNPPVDGIKTIGCSDTTYFPHKTSSLFDNCDKFVCVNTIEELVEIFDYLTLPIIPKSIYGVEIYPDGSVFIGNGDLVLSADQFKEIVEKHNSILKSKEKKSKEKQSKPTEYFYRFMYKELKDAGYRTRNIKTYTEIVFRDLIDHKYIEGYDIDDFDKFKRFSVKHIQSICRLINDDTFEMI